ncbi:MAG: hypothetical protein VYB65_07005 [Myxococcota bacterium]|nr:hypothetical protein [Myxococcota bacterium]
MVRWFGLALLLTSACTVYELESEGDIYRPRVLAMKIEPPEARIGDTVRVTPLVALPVGFDGVIDSTWLDCERLDDEGGDGGESRDWCRDRSRERVISTADELVYAVPETLPQEEVEQFNFVAGYWKRLTLEIKDRLGGEQDRAFKRLVVKPAPNPADPTADQFFEMTRNRNPVLPPLEVFTLDAQNVLTPVAEEAALQANTDYLFRLAIDKVHRQDFQALRIDFTGVDPSQADSLTPEEIEERVRIEERRERMNMRFYRTDGRFGADQKPVRTFDSTAEEPEYYPVEVTWALNTQGRTEAVPARVRLWFVVADGRGGMDWVTLDRPLELGAAPARSVEQGIKSPPDLRRDD